MKKCLVVTCLFGVMTAASVVADDFVDLIKKGNKAYSEKKYTEALDLYHSAEPELPESAELEYNLAGALFQQGNYDEAIERYTKAVNTTDLDLEAQAHYNLGNSYFKKGDFQNAITSYQNTLTINPEDIDAKFNMELARKMLKEQMKPEQQDQDQQQQNEQKQDQQQQQQQEQQNQDDNKEGEEEEQQQQQQQGGENEESKEDQKKQQQQQQVDPQKMSKEDAERILNALKDAEQKIQENIKRQNRQSSQYNGKDW